MTRSTPTLRLGAALLCLHAFAPGALAQQDSGGAAAQVMQMLGIGGKKDAPAASADPAAASGSAPAPSSAPASGQTSQSSQSGLGGSKVLQMLGLGRGGQKEDPKAKGLLDCPEILVDGGRAELRAPPDADASGVRYQLSISRMARDCALKDDEVTVRVGVLGAAVLGPAGQSGAYSGDLRIALRRKSDDKLFGEKTHRVEATIPSGAARSEFTLLVEDLSAPFISAKAGDDYEVVVGFVAPGGGATTPKAARRRGGG